MASKWQVTMWTTLAAILGPGGSYAAGDDAARQQIQINGSTTVGPIADAFKEAFEKMYPNASITVNKTGSGDGAAALVDGRCHIATMSRFMKIGEFRQAVEKGIMPVAHTVAMDGVCVAVHPSNPVRALTSGQVRQVYEGKITNWKDLGGPDRKIVVISRDTSSGTYETFHGLIMGKNAKLFAGVEYVTSNPHMRKRVASTDGAIGYVGLGFVDSTVRALEIDGVMPNRATITSGKYPVSRPLFMFTAGFPKLGSVVHAFVTFHLSERGQEIVEAKGFVPLTQY